MVRLATSGPVAALATAAAVIGAAASLTTAGSAGFSDEVVGASIAVILGAAVLGALVGVVTRATLLSELTGMVGGAGGAAWLAGDARVGALACGAWLIPWSVGLPVRAAGQVAVGRVVTLATAAVLYGTPWLVPERWRDLPNWVLTWNPLVRLHGSVLGEDWFHGPTLYRRVGENFYVYPDPGEALAGPLILVGASLALAAAVALGRERYAAVTARQPSSR